MSMPSHGLGIETARAIKKGRDDRYPVGRPQVFEQLEMKDVASLIKLKALRIEAFELRLRDMADDDYDKQLKQLEQLEDEALDIINYGDMMFCKVRTKASKINEVKQNEESSRRTGRRN